MIREKTKKKGPKGRSQETPKRGRKEAKIQRIRFRRSSKRRGLSVGNTGTSLEEIIPESKTRKKKKGTNGLEQCQAAT